MSSRSRVTSPMMRTARPGPGEGLAPDDLLGQAELLADRAHLVLEQVAQRLDQLEAACRRGARRRCGAILMRAASLVPRLDDVGVERALREEAVASSSSRGSSSKHPDELPPMILRLCSGSVTPAQAARKRSAGVHVDEVHRGSGAGTSRTTCSASPAPQQPVVDEDAGELVADRPVHQGGRDRRVDPAGEPADDRARRPPARGRAATGSSMMRGHGPGGPGSRRRRSRKCCRTSCPRGVCATSGWNCTPIEPARPVLHGGDRRCRGAWPVTVKPAGAARDRCRRGSSTPVWLGGRPSSSETRLRRRSARCVPYSPAAGALATSRPACWAMQLDAVADAQDGDAQLQDRRVDGAGALGVNADAGPPERMIPAGSRAATSAAVMLRGTISL